MRYGICLTTAILVLWSLCATPTGALAQPPPPPPNDTPSACISYWGAVPGGSPIGDVDDIENFDDHENAWDYCYKLEYSAWDSGDTWWIDAPFEPMGHSITGQGASDWSYSYSDGRITWTYGGNVGAGTTYFQFWSAVPPAPAYKEGTPGARFFWGSSNGSVYTDTDEYPSHSQLYTNPEPTSAALVGSAMLLLLDLRRRRKTRSRDRASEATSLEHR